MADHSAWRHADGSEQAALLDAVESGSLEAVVRMLESGVSPNSPVTPSGLRPAHFAAMEGHADVLSALCDAGAEVNEPSDGVSGTVLQYAVQLYDWNEDAAVATSSTLLFPPEEGASDTPAKKSRATHRDVLGPALAFVSARGFVQMVELLLRAGADPNYCAPFDDYQMTPLVQLVYENEQLESHPQIARMLVRLFLTPSSLLYSDTAITLAASPLMAFSPAQVLPRSSSSSSIGLLELARSIDHLHARWSVIHLAFHMDVSVGQARGFQGQTLGSHACSLMIV
jgi:hypothetical protein